MIAQTVNVYEKVFLSKSYLSISKLSLLSATIEQKMTFLCKFLFLKGDLH